MVAERLQPHRVVGRYAMYGEIASGGMAAVHYGRLVGPVGFGRTVAIKRLHPQYARDPEFVAMFLDEARLAARLRHTNVVQTLDVVALDGELFVVMDYVQGESLSKLLRGNTSLGTRIPVKIVTAIMAGVLHGLHAAHECKNARGEPLTIVHRDVSPQNVMVGADGVARVLDFGIAYVAGRVEPTDEGRIAGKLAYMSPEQLSGHKVDRHSDIYSAAVVLWELLTGQRLFSSESHAALSHRVFSGAVDPPSKHAPELPPPLEEVVMRGLALRPEDRWSSAREMAVALERSVGVATPSTVAGWVDLVAGDNLARRAQQLALIEQSCLSEEEETPSHVASQMILKTPPAFATSETLPSSGPATLRPTPAADGQGSYGTSGSLRQTAVEIDAVPPPPDAPPRRARGVVVAALVLSCAVGVGAGALLRTGGAPTAGTTGAAAPVALPPTDPALAPSVPVVAATGAPPAAPTAPLQPGGPGAATSAVGSAASAVASAAASPSASSSPSSLASPRGAPPPRAFAARSATPPPRPAPSAKARSCDPPYVIDGEGHRKYKLECL